MKLIFKTAVAAGLMSLAACGGSGDDALADNVEANAEATADMMEDQADNMSNEAAADVLEDNAQAVREEGEAKADAIDDADVVVNKQ